MKASNVASMILKGAGLLSITAAAVIAGTLAFASIKVPHTGRSRHV